MISLKVGEEWTLDIGDYSFKFSGPMEIEEKDLDMLRDAVHVADEREKKIRKKITREKVGF